MQTRVTNKNIALKNNDDNIAAPESDYLYCQISQLKNAGKGLFTAINIYKDEIITKFEGEILAAAEAKLREQKGNDKYFIMLIDGSTMDCMNKDCFAKYANDAQGLSKSKFKNNATIALDENDKVCLIAKRNIKTGEEIFCSYGKRYWKKHKYEMM
jgi:SET domain-containing protein